MLILAVLIDLAHTYISHEAKKARNFVMLNAELFVLLKELLKLRRF
jgi:hypothetical protein